PVRGRLLRDDDRPTGGQRQAGQFAAGLQAGQQDRGQGGLAGLPLASQQGHRAGGEVAPPQPRLRPPGGGAQVGLAPNQGGHRVGGGVRGGRAGGHGSGGSHW